MTSGPPHVNVGATQNGVWSGSVIGDCPSRMTASKPFFSWFA